MTKLKDWERFLKQETCPKKRRLRAMLMSKLETLLYFNDIVSFPYSHKNKIGILKIRLEKVLCKPGKLWGLNIETGFLVNIKPMSIPLTTQFVVQDGTICETII